MPLLVVGGGGVELELRALCTTLMQRKGLLVSSLNFAILERFKTNGIEPPMAQQELFIKKEPGQKIDHE